MRKTFTPTAASCWNCSLIRNAGELGSVGDPRPLSSSKKLKLQVTTVGCGSPSGSRIRLRQTSSPASLSSVKETFIVQPCAMVADVEMSCVTSCEKLSSLTAEVVLFE